VILLIAAYLVQVMYKAFLQTLQQLFGSNNNILTDPIACQPYGCDTSRHQAIPDVVVFAETTEQVQAVVKLCNEYKIPLTTRGLASGTTGGAVPVQGGLVLSCERMQGILQMDPENKTMTVECGVLNDTVQKIAAQHGFFWPPDPGSAAICTIGGNLACNAAGPRAVKYGTPRENTLALTAVTGNGDIINTGAYTTKNAVGYDLTRLLIGSEGTLAIITEATLKLTPLAENKQTLRISYRDIHTATQAVTHIMTQAVTPCALEFLDQHAIKLIQQQGISLPSDAKALLLIDVDGLTAALPIAIEQIARAATNNGLIKIETAATQNESEQLWQTRRALSPALRTLAPNKINEDIVVPVSFLPELMLGLEQLAERYKILIVNFGHAGNGNIHVNLMFHDEQRAAAENCLKEVFTLVLKLHGSLSGEHGIGIEKRDFTSQQIAPESLALMKEIKRVFDPNGILNPGKIFPA
jgi:D-lactate dehydrogenase (quinone)